MIMTDIAKIIAIDAVLLFVIWYQLFTQDIGFD
jgi:hypothetical protein